MKTLPFLLVVLAFVSISSLGPLGSRGVAAEAPLAGIVGRYSPPEHPEIYLEFKADGTCVVNLIGKPETATYTVQGNDVSLHAPGRPPLVMQIVNGVLTLQGESWPRVGDAAAAAAVAKANAPEPAGPARVTGHYHELENKDPTDYDLRADGTFTFTWHGITLAKNGKFTVRGADVFFGDHGGTHMRIANGLMTDVGNGRKWKLAGAAAPAPGSASAPGATPSPGTPTGSGAEIAGAPSGNPPPAAAGAAPGPGAGSAGTPAGSPSPAGAVAPLPAEGASITLSAREGAGAKRYGASFPEAQMPPNPQGYFWVVDRPDGQTKVADLHHNEWHVAGLAGVYRIRVEYRAGGVNKTVSNVLEVTVPGK